MNLRFPAGNIMIVANMQVPLIKCKQLVRSIAPSSNLFLVVTLQELRRQGLTFIAFYALQRIIEVPLILQSALGGRLGWETDEISRACKFLAGSGLIKIGQALEDRRVRVLQANRSRNSRSAIRYFRRRRSSCRRGAHQRIGPHVWGKIGG